MFWPSILRIYLSGWISFGRWGFTQIIGVILIASGFTVLLGEKTRRFPSSPLVFPFPFCLSFLGKWSSAGVWPSSVFLFWMGFTFWFTFGFWLTSYPFYPLINLISYTETRLFWDKAFVSPLDDPPAAFAWKAYGLSVRQILNHWIKVFAMQDLAVHRIVPFSG